MPKKPGNKPRRPSSGGGRPRNVGVPKRKDGTPYDWRKGKPMLPKNPPVRKKRIGPKRKK